VQADPNSLDISVLTSGPHAVVGIAGELDMATSQLLQAVLDDLLRSRREPRIQRLVLDCSGLSFVDVSGLSPILHARAVLSRRGGTLRLSRPTPSLVQVLDILGLRDEPNFASVPAPQPS
jgi:anti-anti-sigma factor